MRARSNKSLFTILTLMALAASAGVIWFYVGRPIAQTNYYGLLLDKDRKDDVNYKLGDPDLVDSDDVSSFHLGAVQPLIANRHAGDQNAYPKGTDFRNYDRWGYPSNLWISFRKPAGSIFEVQCFSPNVIIGACKPLLGINIGDTEESVKKWLGHPTSAPIYGTTKVLVYPELNVVIWLRRERVYGLAMFHHPPLE
jgi:hypothetical protein